ncbi:hypothetical protein V8E52_012047, partial [Russula decolorans]
MYDELVAEDSDQPSKAYFDYLKVYRMAGEIFSDGYLPGLDQGDFWDEPRSEHLVDQEEHDLQRVVPDNGTCHQHSDTRHTLPLEAEAKIVNLEAANREEEDCEAEDLRKHMCELSVSDEPISA